MTQTVVGLFNTASKAQQAVQQLTGNGFSSSDVDLSIGSSMGSNTAGSNTDFNLDTDNNKDQESGVSRFFKNLFGSDDETNATRYSNAASRGNSVVTVHAKSSDEAERAASILDDNGAINVDEDADDDYNRYDTTTGASPVGVFNETAGATATTPDSDMYDTTEETSSKNSIADTTGKTSIPIIEEQMQVGKRTVETGGARLRSRIVERPVEEELRLREERVYVNRNTVNRAATDADFNAFKEGQIELVEHAEVPVVSKEARVVEEISLGKEVNERTETVRDTVRKTEVDVEDIQGNTTKSADKRNTTNN